MESTAVMDLRSEAFAKRLANLMIATRTQQGRSVRSKARQSDGRFSAKQLKAIERATVALDEDTIEAITELYGCDLGLILPMRLPVVVTSGVISAGGVATAFEPNNSTALLEAYLKLVRSMRREQKAPAVDLRRDDIEVLAGFLQQPGETIVERLGALMGASRSQRTAMAGLFASGAVVIGLVGTAMAGGGGMTARSSLVKGPLHDSFRMVWDDEHTTFSLAGDESGGGAGSGSSGGSVSPGSQVQQQSETEDSARPATNSRGTSTHVRTPAADDDSGMIDQDQTPPDVDQGGAPDPFGGNGGGTGGGSDPVGPEISDPGVPDGSGDQNDGGQSGDQGNGGQSGDQGDQGNGGDQGDGGQSGDQGNGGESGDRGGNAGDQGANGNGGDQGNGGQSGDQGDHGNGGDQGNGGQSGDQGNGGQSGDPGNGGDQGNGGQSGDQGNGGQSGDQGDHGNGGDHGDGGQSGDKGNGGQPDDQGDGGHHGGGESEDRGGNADDQGDNGNGGHQGDGGQSGGQGDQVNGGDQGNGGQSGDQGDRGHHGGGESEDRGGNADDKGVNGQSPGRDQSDDTQDDTKSDTKSHDTKDDKGRGKD